MYMYIWCIYVYIYNTYIGYWISGLEAVFFLKSCRFISFTMDLLLAGQLKAPIWCVFSGLGIEMEMGFFILFIHPGKTKMTMEKTTIWRCISCKKLLIFQCHVSFQGCKFCKFVGFRGNRHVFFPKVSMHVQNHRKGVMRMMLLVRF